ncbi:uncharacterized protein BO80DRAFT_453197 [Aspergillus ibericus CBS 121593]|uniref:NACHT domain-containing protein n=1 Tax=Aspergillus ibericus CBS 121593 TaxID=1448316 RepID=A0A395H8P8_9EURO|nr:hypothetical protein BO80DRAFT_453197 [Aspergillus ibericus CBS 121593]RAL03535.1 hypothetical protein BO80DRAFT_453197 [Aspergillus ibericus CBS 121593]
MSQQWDNHGVNVQFQGTATNPDRCLDYFAVTDPRNVKMRIHQTRGAALKESYDWILHHPQFQHWRNNNDSQVLWIKGDPGKGKTMLLCGIINELGPTTKLEDPLAKTFLSFFFCQATDPELSNAHAVLRGLIAMLVDTEPSFLPHVRKRFKDTGEPRFRDAEAWTALCNIFLDILRDASSDKICIVVDALDECVQDQDELLQFILQGMEEFPHVKWIISSRNHVKQRTRIHDSQSILSLELQENAQSVSLAIGAYISNRIAELQSLQDDDTLLKYVQQILQKKAEGTFLWVALVVQELEHVDGWKVEEVVNDVPRGLDDLYQRMIDQMKQLSNEHREYCQLILSATALAYRPLHLLELGVVCGLPDKITGNSQYLETMIKRSGSFLTVRDSTIYFVHQSAKDFLIKEAALSIFPSGFPAAHRRMFMQSLRALSTSLRRNIYGLNLDKPDITASEIATCQRDGDYDPLVHLRYSCVYWLDHYLEAISESTNKTEPPGTEHICHFFRKHLLHWLESLGLIGEIQHGILSLKRVTRRHQSTHPQHQSMLKEAERFATSNGFIIQEAPLQTYGAALAFCPQSCESKKLYWDERLQFLKHVLVTRESWEPCMQVLDGHTSPVTAVAFSPDGQMVASASNDCTVRLWDTATGRERHSLQGHTDWTVVSASGDGTMRLWDVVIGRERCSLQGYTSWFTAVAFSPDGQTVASASDDGTVRLWDAATGGERIYNVGSAVEFLSFSADGCHLITDHEKWITRGGQRLIWLPPEFRATCMAFSHNCVVLGHVSGLLAFLWLV